MYMYIHIYVELHIFVLVLFVELLIAVVFAKGNANCTLHKSPTHISMILKPRINVPFFTVMKIKMCV